MLSVRKGFSDVEDMACLQCGRTQPSIARSALSSTSIAQRRSKIFFGINLVWKIPLR